MRTITKMLGEKLKSIDEKLRQAEFIISTDQKDRMGEVVEQSWDMEAYKQNPIVLYGHDPSDKDNVLGKAIEIGTQKDGDRTITTAKVQFAEEGTSAGVDTVWKLIAQGILKTVSVGFIPHEFKTLDGDEDTTVLANNELLEFSVVPIPANPNAVALAYEDGTLDEKDAKWLMAQYKKAEGFLEKSMYATMSRKENESAKRKATTMSDEDIQKVAEAVGKAVSDAVKPSLDKLLELAQADADEDKPEGDKPTDDKPADDKPADGEPKDTSDKPADDKPADDSGDDSGEDTNKPKKSFSDAKSKQKDEDGAFDETEELDEAAEKAFIASLEKDYKELSE